MIINTDKLKQQIVKHYAKKIKEHNRIKPDNCDLSDEKFKELNNLSIWHISKTKIEKLDAIDLVEQIVEQFSEK